MNYVRHLNAFFAFVRSDQRLTSSHVSLYMALFQYWNFNRFNNPFSIYRDNIMQLSKLSKNTYHKCVKELHEAKYIYYHPSTSKFQPVRISVIRLDKEEEPESKYQQLDLFESPSPSLRGGTTKQTGEGFRVRSSPKNETGSVANLSQHSPNITTGTVSNLGHNIKPNIKQRETPTQEIFKQNKKIQEAENDMAGVSNLILVTITEVEEHFKQSSYPATEAKKFYNHYKALGWKIQGVTPIEDWKPLVEKWMTNAARWSDKKQESAATNPVNDLQYLYTTFLEGKNFFHHITAQHFDLLKLELSEETMQQARQERISQVTGTNQHSLNQLWDAYLNADDTNKLIQKDRSNLIALAKRMEVLKQFRRLKQSGTHSLIIKSNQP